MRNERREQIEGAKTKTRCILRRTAMWKRMENETEGGIMYREGRGHRRKEGGSRIDPKRCGGKHSPMHEAAQRPRAAEVHARAGHVRTRSDDHVLPAGEAHRGRSTGGRRCAGGGGGAA